MDYLYTKRMLSGCLSVHCYIFNDTAVWFLSNYSKCLQFQLPKKKTASNNTSSRIIKNYRISPLATFLKTAFRPNDSKCLPLGDPPSKKVNNAKLKEEC